MKKENVIRLIVWGIIFLILVAIIATGIIAYNSGYGKKGSILYNTKPIAEQFNNLDSLKKYIDAGIEINAEAKDNKIIIDYSTLTNNAIFEFIYENKSNIKTLRFSYNNLTDQSAKIIVEFMIDAVSIINGYKEGEVFEKFTLEDFINTKIEQGILIEDEKNVRTVYINIDKSILESKNEINNYNKEIFKNTLNELYALAKEEYIKSPVEAQYYFNENIATCKIGRIELPKLNTTPSYKYYIRINDEGNITKLYLTNDRYGYSFNDLNGLNIDENINIIEKNINKNKYNEIDDFISNMCNNSSENEEETTTE